MRKTLTAFAITVAALSAMPATAAQITNEKSQIEFVTTDNIAALLTELGAQQVQAQASGKSKSVTFQDGQIPYSVVLGVCDQGTGANCEAAIMVVIFEGGTNNYALDSFNTFNKEHPFVSAIKLEENRFALSRMVVTTGGVSKKNLGVNIASFAQGPGALMQYLASQLVAGYQDGRTAAAFQRTSFGAAPLRPVYATPRDLAQVERALNIPKGSPTLRR